MKRPKSVNQNLDIYLPLVLSTAWRLHRLHNLPQHIHEDLVQEGFIGLLDAHTRYDADRLISFGTFALPRVRGAMLDYLHREGRGDCINQGFEHDHAQQPIEQAVAARESLSLISTTVSNLSPRRRRVMEAVVNFESLEEAAEEVAVNHRKARMWRLEFLSKLRVEVAA
jgi:RNA polymerase sigma factor (sigma-70 family)